MIKGAIASAVIILNRCTSVVATITPLVYESYRVSTDWFAYRVNEKFTLGRR